MKSYKSKNYFRKNMNGVTITRDEFSKLPRMQKDLVIFDNLDYIKRKMDSYYFHRKIKYSWLAGLTAVLGWVIGAKVNS